MCSSFLHECPADILVILISPVSAHRLVSRYQRRISGPFIDRVDIFVEVPHIEYEKLADNRQAKNPRESGTGWKLPA